MAKKYDLIVIGSGPAGEKGAAQAAFFGKRVIVIDSLPRPGGLAVSTGGIPTKAMREGAIYLSGLGQKPAACNRRALYAPGLLMARRVEASEIMTAAVERNLIRHGIERILGRAHFLLPRQVEVDTLKGERVLLEAEVVFLASGSRPHHPTNIPMNLPGVYDSENVLDIDQVPESLIVIGGGAVGCEYASIFAALGAHVAIVGGGHLLPTLDAEMSGMLAECFNSMAIRVILATSVVGVERVGSALQARLADRRTADETEYGRRYERYVY